MNSPNRNLAIVRYVRDQRHTVIQTARHFKVSRQWVYTLLRRFDEGGQDAILPQSKAPKTTPKALSLALRREIITMRKHLSQSGLDAGPDTIAAHLAAKGMRVPSTSTIRRVITCAGLVAPQPQKRPKSSYIRFEAASPNECWQADITYIFLANGIRAEVLDFLDDNSRYLLFIKAYSACQGKDVTVAMKHLIDQFGPPASTLTDNGLVFTARLAGAKGGRNGFEVLLNKHHIQQKNGRPGHPQTQGKIERFHQTLKRWYKHQQPPATLSELQELLNEFQNNYNEQRPHRSLSGSTPFQAYKARTKATPGDLNKDEWRTRTDTVDKAGRVCLRYAGRQYHLGIGRAYQGQKITMVVVDKHITTALTHTGEIITEHDLDTSRDYQKPTWKNRP